MGAFEYGHLKVVEFLLEKWANVKDTESRQGGSEFTNIVKKKSYFCFPSNHIE
jgi:hypothetical protein